MHVRGDRAQNLRCSYIREHLNGDFWLNCKMAPLRIPGRRHREFLAGKSHRTGIKTPVPQMPVPSPQDPAPTPSTPPETGSRRGRPPRPDLQPPPEATTRAALARLLEITSSRRTGQRYWDFPFDVAQPEGTPPTGRARRISVHEAMSKLRAAEKFLPGTAQQALDEWDKLSADVRGRLGTLVMRIGRSERPRRLGSRTFSWRRLEEKLYELAQRAETEGQPFAATEPTQTELARSLRMGVRTLQKALRRLRSEMEKAPGLEVRVNLWYGEPTPSRPGSRPHGSRLWVSRWDTRTEREALAAGLLPADTAAQQRAANAALRLRREKRQ